ncbi:MAG TPA: hypothetical protein VFA45_01445 [Actinomycetes bacterium]|jgi:hypothetical protein|nr:hypothetical protein [Actinomycetes bacterium]
MQHKSSQRRDLGNRVASIAWQVAESIAAAIELGVEPPVTVIMAERDLWRWAERLRRAAPQTDLPSASRIVAAVLLVEVDAVRDFGWLAHNIVQTAGPEGDTWRVRHTTIHPDPAAIYRRRPRSSGEAER